MFKLGITIDICYIILGSLTLAAQGQVAAPLSQAHWIAAAPDSTKPTTPATPGPVGTAALLPIFRRTFNVPSKPTSAILYLSGLGHFEAHIDGANVTSNLLTPGWSDYRKRVYYDTFDVTELIVPGPNAIGVLLGNGMYNVPPTPGRYTKFTGSFGQPKLIAELRLRFADGTQQTILSDATWTTSHGPITFTSIYGGEDYDAHLEQPGWDNTNFAPSPAWSPATLVASPGGALIPETIPPVVANETYPPLRITHPRPGVDVYDLGENMAGWPELTVSGEPGASVRMLPGELLDANGLVTQRSASASPKNPNVDTYTLKGGAAETWHPRFSYYGFRYVQVETTGTANVIRLSGRFLHDKLHVDGSFTSSSDLLNRIHVLIDRAILSNSVSVLTDCPTREKLGWLEQTHLAAASMMYNYGLGSLYAKMADDIADAQLANGMVPDIAPEYTTFSGGFRDSAEWGSAAILSPWFAYQFYGDMALLRDHYDTMKRYAAFLHDAATDHILTKGLGDWYDIGPRPPGVEQLTSAGVTATATYYQDLIALARIATLLNHPADAERYTREAAEVKAAYNARFFHADTNQYDTGSQTANAMPLVVGLVPEDRREAVLANLVADIHAHSDHVTAGDVGFHYVVRALTDGRRSDVLYAMLMRTDKPSYGDQIAHGATTLTEAWDANPNSSQNHFMLGHVEEWFYRGLAGIDLDMSRAPAERLRIAPAVPGDLQSASASYDSVLGRISSAWSRIDATLHLDITIPNGASATIVMPLGFDKPSKITSDQPARPTRIHPDAPGAQVFSATAGTYHFEATQ